MNDMIIFNMKDLDHVEAFLKGNSNIRIQEFNITNVKEEYLYEHKILHDKLITFSKYDCFL